MKKKIIIMGATSGIGLEVARLFHQQRHIIAIAGRRMDNLQRISTELANCPYAQIDVTDTQAPTRLQELIEDLGGMDIYLHVSGIGKQNRQLDTDVELATVETNALGFTRLVNHACHYFRTQGSGHIAAVSSIAGTKGLGAALRILQPKDIATAIWRHWHNWPTCRDSIFISPTYVQAL